MSTNNVDYNRLVNDANAKMERLAKRRNTAIGALVPELLPRDQSNPLMTSRHMSRAIVDLVEPHQAAELKAAQSELDTGIDNLFAGMPGASEEDKTTFKDQLRGIALMKESGTPIKGTDLLSIISLTFKGLGREDQLGEITEMLIEGNPKGVSHGGSADEQGEQLDSLTGSAPSSTTKTKSANPLEIISDLLDEQESKIDGFESPDSLFTRYQQRAAELERQRKEAYAAKEAKWKAEYENFDIECAYLGLPRYEKNIDGFLSELVRDDLPSVQRVSYVRLLKDAIYKYAEANVLASKYRPELGHDALAIFHLQQKKDTEVQDLASQNSVQEEIEPSSAEISAAPAMVSKHEKQIDALFAELLKDDVIPSARKMFVDTLKQTINDYVTQYRLASKGQTLDDKETSMVKQ